MTHKEHIEIVIDKTFSILQNTYENQQENSKGEKVYSYNPESRIIFPMYRDDSTRFSEQELRFIFVEQLNKEIFENGWDVYYSVETPTKFRYNFTDKDNPKVFKNDEGGESAQFDLVIHDSQFKRIILIEFKANNAPIHEHEKDFKKLNEEGNDDTLTYFLEVVKSSDSGTTKSLNEKKSSYNGVFKCWSCSAKKYII